MGQFLTEKNGGRCGPVGLFRATLMVAGLLMISDGELVILIVLDNVLRGAGND